MRNIREYIELYTDYLISNSGLAMATRLSVVADGEVSHDQTMRFLSKEDFTSKTLWKEVKPIVRRHQSEEGYIIFDDLSFYTNKI